MKCPTCGSEEFYLKDPDDEYEIYEFTCSGDDIAFSDDIDTGDIPEIENETETYCNKCAWHGKYGALDD